MTGRKIGGGRVLGRPTQTPSSSPLPKRNSSLLSPSASTTSVASSASTSYTSTENQDLSSRVTLGREDAPSPIAAAEASSRLACPICNEEMMTLLQLNRHLDDIHKNLEEVRQDEVKDWFEKQMIKAKKFQPLVVLNQKLKGLEVFESNETTPEQIASTATPSKAPEPLMFDPDEVITKSHWQRPGPNDACSEPSCGKRLNATNGKINCRKCGKLFCDDHTMYQIKLSRSAQHEPVRGMWCRVCETCYKSREGYNDHSGFTRDHTEMFKKNRRKVVDKNFLEISRLEKRLTKLTQLLANPPEQSMGNSGIWNAINSFKDQRKDLEQSLVAWEDDSTVMRCPYCHQEFSKYTFRRHHCRLCGKVVCGDPMTHCSTEVPLDVDANGPGSEKPLEKVKIDIRMCKECQHTIFSKKDLARDMADTPPDVRSYDNLIQFERGIRIMLPKFQKLLTALQDPDRPPSPAQLAEASKVRKRLIDSFTQYDMAARRIRDLPTTSGAQKKLQKAVYQKAYSFLHLHMLPLKTLPKVLKHASPHGSSPLRSPHSRQSSLAAIRYNDAHGLSPSGSRGGPASINGGRAKSHTSASSAAVSALEEEEKQLKERLIVLEEQKFFVGEMVADANRRRRFDEVAALAANAADLSREIDQIRGQIAQLDFEAVYTGDGSVGGSTFGGR